MNTKVSILMPVYNRQDMVGSAIKSVLAQTSQAWQLIIYNDGSTDQSDKICRQFAGKSTNIHITGSTTNNGIVYARNKLLEACNTEYGMWLDSDDLCSIYRIEMMLDLIGKFDVIWSNWQPFMTTSDATLPDYTKKPIQCDKLPRHYPTILFRMERAPRFQEVMFNGTPTTVSGEDQEWFKRFQATGITETHTNYILYYYRRHSARITSWKRPGGNPDWLARMSNRVTGPHNTGHASNPQ